MMGIKLTITEPGMSSGNSQYIMWVNCDDTLKTAGYPWFPTVDNIVDLIPERLKPHYPQGTTSTTPL
jgi:hypothetical protein